MLLLPLLLSIPPQAAPAAAPQADAWFHNGNLILPLEVDGSTFGFRFADDWTEPQVRRLLASLPGVNPDSAARAVWQPGRTALVEMLAPLAPRAALARAAEWRALPGVTIAGPRFLAPGPDPMFLTEEILLRWHDSAPAAERERLTAGLERTGTIDYAVRPGEVWRVAPGADPLAIANAIASSGLVEFALPDFQVRRVTTATTNDPLFGQQWHLEATGQNGTVPDADVDASGAWNVTRGDPSVIIAVVDEGIDLGHPDLNLVPGWDVLDNDSDPSAEDGPLGLFPENHSTAVSGVAAARGDNGLGVSGVAQLCRVMPIRFLSSNIFNPPTIQDEADAFNFARSQGAAVINNSWGPVGAAALAASTKAAIDDCNEHGRGGLGMVIFFAAGNSGTDNSNNGYASYEGVLGVSAINDQGVLSSYSSFGPSVDLCAPSNGGVNGIVTTDRRGNDGYSSGDYTTSFGGTSSASPTAAGVMLLILSANPSLSRAEAIGILLGTTDLVDPTGGNYDAFGHSNLYGFGRANAEAAVLAAAAGGLPKDSITLTAPATGVAGAPVSIQFTQAPANAPFGVLAALGVAGSIVQGHCFDVGAPAAVIGTGRTTAGGGGSFTFTPPAAYAGRTVWVEIGALGPAGIQDSNAAGVALQ